MGEDGSWRRYLLIAVAVVITAVAAMVAATITAVHARR